MACVSGQQRDALWQLCGVRGGHARSVLYSSFSRTPHLLLLQHLPFVPPSGRTSLALGRLWLSDEGLAVGGVCIAGYRMLSQQPQEERSMITTQALPQTLPCNHHTDTVVRVATAKRWCVVNDYFK